MRSKNFVHSPFFSKAVCKLEHPRLVNDDSFCWAQSLEMTNMKSVKDSIIGRSKTCVLNG